MNARIRVGRLTLTASFTAAAIFVAMLGRAAAQPPTAPPPQPMPPPPGSVYVDQPAPGPKPTPGQQPPPPMGQRNEGPQGFSVVLVVGDLQGTDAIDNVPVAARRALTDMKDFLPYKSYRLLDAQWVLCCGGKGSSTIRLRGVEDQEFELDLRSSPGGTGINVNFHLRQASESAGRHVVPSEMPVPRDALAQETQSRLSALVREIDTLERERAALEADIVKARERVEIGTESREGVRRLEAQRATAAERLLNLLREREAAQQGYADASASPKPLRARSVIDTSFRMDIGETVVVGTSRVKGGSQALIALLTAVPQRPRTR
jgi:hypothetical protein